MIPAIPSIPISDVPEWSMPSRLQNAVIAQSSGMALTPGDDDGLVGHSRRHFTMRISHSDDGDRLTVHDAKGRLIRPGSPIASRANAG